MTKIPISILKVALQLDQYYKKSTTSLKENLVRKNNHLNHQGLNLSHDCITSWEKMLLCVQHVSQKKKAT